MKSHHSLVAEHALRLPTLSNNIDSFSFSASPNRFPFPVLPNLHFMRQDIRSVIFPMSNRGVLLADDRHKHIQRQRHPHPYLRSKSLMPYPAHIPRATNTSSVDFQEYTVASLAVPQPAHSQPQTVGRQRNSQSTTNDVPMVAFPTSRDTGLPFFNYSQEDLDMVLYGYSGELRERFVSINENVANNLDRNCNNFAISGLNLSESLLSIKKSFWEANELTSLKLSAESNGDFSDAVSSPSPVSTTTAASCHSLDKHSK